MKAPRETLAWIALLCAAGLIGCEESDKGVSRSVRVSNFADAPVTLTYTIKSIYSSSPSTADTTLGVGKAADIRPYFVNSDGAMVSIRVTKGNRATTIVLSKHETAISILTQDFS